MSAPIILIIDAGEENRGLHARYLRLAGFEVLEAAGGAQGLAMAPRADVILLDVHLPDIDGLEVCRRLKAGAATALIPILQTSASVIPTQDTASGSQGEADACLGLPLEPVELVATIRALVRLRRAEATVQRMAGEWQATFDAIGDGICLLDGNGRIVQFNRGLATRFPATEPVAAGRPLAQALRLDDPAEVSSFLAAASGETKDFPAGPRWLRLCAHRATDNQALEGRTVCVVSDITRFRAIENSLRAAETQLATHASTLEKHVEERTRELHRRNEELEAFTYSISHDLRSPLRSMQNFAGILIEELADGLAEKHLDYLKRIETACLRMDRLTTDLLRYSQLAQADIALTSLDTAALLQQSVDELVFEAKVPRNVFTLERPLPRVLGNAAVLSQVFHNLLGNALKFTRSDQPPRIRCHAESLDGRIRLIFEDNGIGIEARYLDKIFRPFEKLHPPSRYAGTGIGLAIVQRGVERMGGRVGVESTLGRGSTFWIELPAG